MSAQAVDALRHESQALEKLLPDLTPGKWSAASRCPGWRVQDVVCHMASIFQQLCDPASVPTDESLGEKSVDLAVDARRHWTSTEVANAYRKWSTRALTKLAGQQDNPVASTVVKLGGLGRHPVHLLANAYAFDHHCHIRHDLALPTPVNWPSGTDPADLTSAASEVKSPAWSRIGHPG